MQVARSFRQAAVMSRQARLFSTIKVGDKLPSALVSVVKHGEDGFKSESVDTSSYFENKHVVLVGYPGAFTPTCMATHIPQYIENAEQIKAQGADEVICMSVNDPFVVTAFAQHLGGKDKVSFLADGNGEFTKALGLEMDLSVAFLATRGKRMSMVVKNNEVVEMNNEDGPGLTETSSCSTILNHSPSHSTSDTATNIHVLTLIFERLAKL